MGDGLPGWLPEELLEEEVYKEQQNIRIKTERARYRKLVTEIEGFDKTIDIHSLAKKLKRKLACGGSVKDNKIILQGDQKEKTKQALIEMGFPENTIDVL